MSAEVSQINHYFARVTFFQIQEDSVFSCFVGETNLQNFDFLKLCLENPMDRGPWRATVHEVTRVRCDLVTKQQQHICVYVCTHTHTYRYVIYNIYNVISM